MVLIKNLPFSLHAQNTEQFIHVSHNTECFSNFKIEVNIRKYIQ